MDFFETSAKSKINVKEAFEKLANSIFIRIFTKCEDPQM